MPDMMEHIEYLTKEVGARPASTEEEQQAALYITEEFQEQPGITAKIEDFNCASGVETACNVCVIASIVITILAMIFSILAIPAVIITILAAVLIALEVWNKPVLSMLFGRGISQNVVAKFQPPKTGSQSARSRKVVLVARYDSGKVQNSMAQGNIERTMLLRKVSTYAMVALPIFLLIRFTFFLHATGVLLIILNIITALVLIVAAARLLPAIMDATGAYNDAANSNASGIAVLLRLAEIIGELPAVENPAMYLEDAEPSDATGFVFGEMPVIHGEDEAYEAGVVPEGANLVYDVDPNASTGAIPVIGAAAGVAAMGAYDEVEETEEEALAAAKAAIAALTGKPIKVYAPIKGNDEEEPVVEAEPEPEEEPAVEGPEVEDNEMKEDYSTDGAITFRDRDSASLGEEGDMVGSAESADDEYSVYDPYAEIGIPDWYQRAQAKAKKVDDVDPDSIPKSQYAGAFTVASAAGDEQAEIADAAAATENVADYVMEEELLAMAPETQQKIKELQEKIKEYEENAQTAQKRAELEEEYAQEEAAAAAAAEAASAEAEAAAKPAINLPLIDADADKTIAYVPEFVENPNAEPKEKPEDLRSALRSALPSLGVTDLFSPDEEGPTKAEAPIPEEIEEMAEGLADVELSAPALDEFKTTVLDLGEEAEEAVEEFEDEVEDLVEEAAPVIDIPESRFGGFFDRFKKKKEPAKAAPILAPEPMSEPEPVDEQEFLETVQEIVEQASAPIPNENFQEIEIGSTSDFSSWNRGWNGGAFSALKERFLGRNDGSSDDYAEDEVYDYSNDSYNIEYDKDPNAAYSIRHSDGTKEHFGAGSSRLGGYEGSPASKVRGEHQEELAGYDDYDEYEAVPEEEYYPEFEEVIEALPQQEKIIQFRSGTVDTEVWFVALGAELNGHAGMKAFIQQHNKELRGAVIVEIDAMGAGELSFIENEGMFTKTQAPSRMKRYVKKAADLLGIRVPSVKVPYGMSTACYANRMGLQAIRLAGMDGIKPKYFAEADDVIENIDPELLAENAEFVLELVKSI